MAAPGKSSRWGSLLQQAVAGVEARLDTILAEGEMPQPKSTKASQPQAATVTPKASSAGPSRSSSNSRASDRLQERLAKAVAAKSSTSETKRPSFSDLPRQREAEGQNEGIANTGESSSAASSRVPTRDASLDIPSNRGEREAPCTNEIAFAGTPELAGVDLTAVNGHHSSDEVITEEPTAGMSEIAMTSARILPAGPASSSDNPDASWEHNSGNYGELAQEVEQLRSRFDEADAKHRKEVHEYVERIDALQSKLQFLARETTETARRSAASSPAGGAERKLAEKDEKIALLMEEGQTLAATEQKHRAIIRKLRSRISEDEKALAEMASERDKVRAEIGVRMAGTTRSDELERLRAESSARATKLQAEVDSLRSDISDRDALVTRLKLELQSEAERQTAIIAKMNSEGAERDRRRQREIEDAIAEMEVEKTLVADRSRSQVAELNEKAARAAERTRAAELEMKGELQVMESKLEAMRALAEEASSGAANDSQAKLLRQVETLQTQYATASENWQGIEASLVARIGSLEKERDDAVRRESDMRKKAREAATRFRRQEDELQELHIKFSGLQQRADASQGRLDSLTRRAEDAEAALSQARSDAEKHRTPKPERAEAAVDRERRSWLDDIPAMSPRNQSRPDSPLLSMPPRTLSSDLLAFQGPSAKSRKASSPSSLADGFGEGHPPSQRLSNQAPLQAPAIPSSSGVSPTTIQSPFDSHADLTSTPSLAAGEKDDMFEGFESLSSPRQVMQDVMSVSTVAAGPSVQLVERMSAAIRRLEGEKMAAREELARISSQRDEARAEIVALMREVEGGRTSSAKIASLEAEVADINARYQTTLEMLGEKSELVEELRADVEDVKAMYRDLIERTVR